MGITFQPYLGIIDQLEERINGCIEKNPELRKLNDPWQWLEVPGFEYKDLEPSLSQMAAALSKCLHNSKEIPK